MVSDIFLANNNLTDASKKLRTIHDSVSKIQGNMRNKSMDMYYKLSLLAGGVLSLSITYIGYLASTPTHKIIYTEFLFVSWIALLLTVFTGIYRNHFNLDMGHYQTLNVLNKARLEEFKATLVLLETSPQQFANLHTTEDISRQIVTTKANIAKVEKAIKSVEKLEKRNSKLWIITQNTAHLSFLIGMIFITFFAALNLPVKLEFSLINMLTDK